MRVCGNGPGVHAEWHVRVKNGMVGEWVLVLDTVQSKGEQLFLMRYTVTGTTLEFCWLGIFTYHLQKAYVDYLAFNY